jgi:two-component system, NtrC family, response regulator GlrR
MYRPLGSAKSIVADVRIITATNTDLRQRVEMKLFRKDLYYRIHVLSLHLPPHIHLSPGAARKLLGYPRLGNGRELEGVIQRAVILVPSSTIEPNDIELATCYRGEMLEDGFRNAKLQADKHFERAYLIDILSAQGNITRAAQKQQQRSAVPFNACCVNMVWTAAPFKATSRGANRPCNRAKFAHDSPHR